MEDEKLARAHAGACWDDPIRFAAKGPRTEAYAQAALAELERVQSSSQGMVHALLEGGNQIARQLNADAFQGFREIVQNADDLKATAVRVGVRVTSEGRQLLVAHNGEPVELMHVLPMIYPSISTRRGEARAKGRFGMGLKTLGRLGWGLTVHSVPYHFMARDNFAVRAAPAEALKGFYDPEVDTLITLNLDDEVEPEFLREAFGLWSSGELLFLDSVRSVTVFDLDLGERLFDLVLELKAAPSIFRLQGPDGEVEVREDRFELSGLLWVRYSGDVVVPAGQRRAHKATGATTRLALALPVEGRSDGRVHVALPTRIATRSPFSLDAQFNPATSREELSSDSWNKWLIGAVSRFSGTLAIHLARQGSPLTWSVVPVGAATNSTSDWVNDRFREGWAEAIAAFQVEVALIGPSPELPLAGVSYAEGVVGDLLEPEDHVEVRGAPMLPLAIRDAPGRWRTVVEALGVSQRITLEDVVHACEGGFAAKSAAWLLALAARCIASGREQLLYEAAWTPLMAGGRARPQTRQGAFELLVLEPATQAFAERHGLCRTVDPIMLEEVCEPVRSWLMDYANLVSAATARDVLGAFAARYRDQPFPVSREELIALRNLFADVPERGVEALGAAVGKALLIEAFRYEGDPQGRQKQVLLRVRPSDVYLSRTIEDEADGWSRAAGTTPGLVWTSAAYAEVFKVSTRRSSGTSAMRRFRAAKRFLVLLGARTAPRLERVDTPISNGLSPHQRRARIVIGRTTGHLANDHISSDLDRVLEDLIAVSGIAKGRRRVRRADREGDRSVALFRCLTSCWAELEGQTTTAVYRTSLYGGALARVPATWLSRLMDLPWLANEAGTLSRPADLWIGTRISRAIEGDPARFAAGLDGRDASQPLTEALRMRVDPRASELVTALEARREHPGDGDAADLLRIYKALSAYCPQGAFAPAPDARVGDLTVNSLRAKFGIYRARPGLISGYLTNRDDKTWFSPTAVHAGKDIFHGRAPFVLAERDLAPLWNALNITPPAIEDCVRELIDIAKAPPSAANDALLIDVYRHLDGLLVEKPTAVGRRRLAEIPLRIRDAWSTKRPIHLSEYHRAEVTAVAIWEPPCAPSSMPHFVEAIGAEALRVDDTPRSEVFGERPELQDRFAAAARILRSDLARDDEASYRALEPWSRLEGLRLVVHGVDGLVVQALPRETKAFPMIVRAHADLGGAAIHVESGEMLGRTEYGGAALSRFAGPARRREIALAWASAWAASEDDLASTAIALAGEEARRGAESLTAEFERQSRMPNRRLVAIPTRTPTTPSAPPRIEVRKLKPLPESVDFTVALRDAAVGSKSGMQPGKIMPLRSSPRPGGSGQISGGGHRAPVTAHRQYDNAQLQAQGWAYLKAAIEEGDIRLVDLQDERGVGADGTVDWKKYFEMKSFAREAPTTVSLTTKEFQRARASKGQFFLVMVSGLEEGFETELQVYADPLNSLPWTVQGSVSVSGLGAGPAIGLKVLPPTGLTDAEADEDSVSSTLLHDGWPAADPSHS